MGIKTPYLNLVVVLEPLYPVVGLGRLNPTHMLHKHGFLELF
jgi:hypothetical protein